MRIDKKSDGFTLIEIMIVLAIVAILVTVAMPSYKASVDRSRRSDALIGLEKTAAIQEQYFFQANQYATKSNDLGGTEGDLLSPEGHYIITSTSTTEDALDFTLTATAKTPSAQADENCYYLRLSHTGLRTAHKESDSGYATDEPNCFRD